MGFNFYHVGDGVKMSDEICSLCGQRVRIVGKTTMHYAGVDAHELSIAVEALEEITVVSPEWMRTLAKEALAKIKKEPSPNE